MKLLEELKRRNVFRAGAAYVVLGWLVIQVTDTISPALKLPEWTLPFVIWVGFIGLRDCGSRAQVEPWPRITEK